MSQSKVQHIFRVFDALNLVKGIKAVGGPDHQTYYIESDVYAPDRRITPLILQPYVEVSDPNGVIPAGDKIGELSSASWYIGEAILANKITAKESEATLDTPFAIGENNALHVRKNSTKSILLIFEGEYLDIRKDKNIHISLTYTLTTTSNTEVKPAPKLVLSKPQSWKYCPLENQTKAVIEATVSQDSKLYQSAVQWVKVEGDKETLIGEDDPFYIEGQNTDKLTINPSLMGSTLIRAKNHDEVFYNQVYGINPEWDHRMDEVMRNRNLLALSKRMQGVFIYQNHPNNLTISASSKACSYVINVTNKRVISLSTAKNSTFNNNRFGLAFYDEFKNGALPLSVPFNFISGQPDQEIYENIEVPEEATIAVFYYDNRDVDNIPTKIKLEEGSVATPYTPAPEDLHNRNYLIESYSEITSTSAIFINLNYNLIYNNIGNYISISMDCIDTDDGTHKIDFYLRDMNSGITLEPKSEVFDVTNYYKRISHTFIIPNSVKDTKEVGIGIRGNTYIPGGSDINKGKFSIKNIKLELDSIATKWTFAPEDFAPHGILKGTYQSDIKFTRYFPKLETEIDFLTGDTLRAGMDTVKMKAVFKTNKEEIKNPEQYFDIKWYLDPVEAGGKAEYLGQGESLEVPISKIPPKARAIPFRLEYEFK